jgi:hypothetical protein
MAPSHDFIRALYSPLLIYFCLPNPCSNSSPSTAFLTIQKKKKLDREFLTGGLKFFLVGAMVVTCPALNQALCRGGRNDLLSLAWTRASVSKAKREVSFSETKK